jgi:aminopeptidase
MAEVLVDYSLGVKEGELVVVAGPVGASAFALVLQERILAAGGHPAVRLQPDELAESLLRSGSAEQLEWINPVTRGLLEQADGYVSLVAPSNTRALTGVDPKASAARRRARRSINELLEAREHRGQLRSVVSAVPTHALAQEASMSLRDYSELVVQAGFLDADDPVAAWRDFGARAASLVERLTGTSNVRIQADRTDLSVGVAGRTWVAADGTQNFPDGEVYTAPVEETIEGTIYFPHATIIEGRRVEGVELTFAAGIVVRGRAERGQSDLDALLETDDGARRAGELAFGLNDRVQRFTGESLFDEKIAGTIHLALGSAYPECGGSNRSALHWDLVCDLRSGGVVHVDGTEVQRDGRFVDGWFDPSPKT